MNNELDNQLVALLKSVNESASDTKIFILSELPEVVVQLLNWYSIYYFIIFVICLTTIVLMIVLWLKYIMPQQKAFDSSDPFDTSPAVIWGLIYIMPIIAVTVNISLQWLKIWVAPKLWLIEYTAIQIKG